MNILQTPEIEGLDYISFNYTVCFGAGKNHLVVDFANAGGGHYPVLKMDEQCQCPLSCEELSNIAKWANRVCRELDKREIITE